MRLVPILNLIPPFLSKICINNTLLFLLMKTKENLGLAQVVRESGELGYVRSTIPSKFKKKKIYFIYKKKN